MKLVKHAGNLWRYELREHEKQILETLLTKYPFTKLQPVKMSKGHPDAEALERENLLNESLAVHQTGLKQMAGKLMKESLRKEQDLWLLKLDHESREVLLQILNDVRIGAWKEMGEPADVNKPPKNSGIKPQLWNLMYLAGYFEECLVGSELE